MLSLNRIGTSLLEVTIAIGSLSFVGFGFSQMVSSAFKANRDLTSQYELNQVSQAATTILNRIESCDRSGLIGLTLNPASPSSVPISLHKPEATQPGESLLEEGHDIGNQHKVKSLRITSMVRLGDLAIGNVYFTTLALTTAYNLTRDIEKERTKNLHFNVVLDNSNKVVQCYSGKVSETTTVTTPPPSRPNTMVQCTGSDEYMYAYNPFTFQVKCRKHEYCVDMKTPENYYQRVFRDIYGQQIASQSENYYHDNMMTIWNANIGRGEKAARYEMALWLVQSAEYFRVYATKWFIEFRGRRPTIPELDDLYWQHWRRADDYAIVRGRLIAGDAESLAYHGGSCQNLVIAMGKNILLREFDGASITYWENRCNVEGPASAGCGIADLKEAYAVVVAGGMANLEPNDDQPKKYMLEKGWFQNFLHRGGEELEVQKYISLFTGEPPGPPLPAPPEKLNYVEVLAELLSSDAYVNRCQ